MNKKVLKYEEMFLDFLLNFERAKQLADQLDVEFFETTAKENVNVKVNWMTRLLLIIRL